MSKCLFAIIRPEQLAAVARIDLNEHHTIDPDFDVQLPTAEHWDEERWRAELSRKELKGVLVTEYYQGTHILGAFIYEVTEDGYRLVRWVRSIEHDSQIDNFMDYALMWLVEKTYREEKPTLSVLLPDDAFDTLKLFADLKWSSQPQRDYFGDGLDYWLLTFKNKKVYKEKAHDARS